MQKEIHYTGYATEPSDYECPDGQLALSLNLISEDAQVKPVFQPKALMQMPNSMTVIYVHNNNSPKYKHYIILDHVGTENIFTWVDSEFHSGDTPASSGDVGIATQGHTFLTLADSVDIHQVTSVGNTLIILTSEGMHYVLWKGGNYTHLGNHLPETALSFSLLGDFVESEEFEITFDSNIDTAHYFDTDFNEGNKNKITSQVLAQVNKFIAEHSTNVGRFIYPFFVRYAYRLYDGSLTMHSAPVLMVCSSDITPAVFLAPGHTLENNKAYARVCAVECRLQYARRTSIPTDWQDIIKSVDIFISKPIYTYDQNGYCTGFDYTEDEYENGELVRHGYHGNTFSYVRHSNQHPDLDINDYPLRHQWNPLFRLYSFTHYNSSSQTPFSHPAYCVKLPRRTADQVAADIRTCGVFYILKSIPIDQLPDSRSVIEIEKEYLQSLVNREVMTDDYDSHDTLIPQYAFPYNSRLNVANITKLLYQGFNPLAMFNYTDGYIGEVLPQEYDFTLDITVYFVSKHDGRDIITKGSTEKLAYGWYPEFIYCHDSAAYKAIVVRHKDGLGTNVMEYDLEPHTVLNGAFCFTGWGKGRELSTVPTESTDRSFSLPNKIYTSEVNNPFHFPVSGINTVGTGTIIGISAAAKAMSQGQFGQFPLYAFSTDGVWALEVSSTGTYSAKQPITRDVCTNTDSITQIDSSVLFATHRGIMMLTGSTATCITDTINAEQPFDVTTLPHFDELHSLIHTTSDACVPTKPFLQFIDGCRMIFDYIHQRIILFNPKTTTTNSVTTRDYTYAYVFSLRSQSWGMMYSELQEPINDYPDALAMTHSGELVTFSQNDDDEINGLLVTRPIKLDAPDALKTISAIIQRGHFQRGDVKVALYASRNLYGWHLVWTSQDQYLRGFRGTPFKYFRIALVTTLSDGKSLFGASIDYTPKQNNQLR